MHRTTLLAILTVLGIGASAAEMSALEAAQRMYDAVAYEKSIETVFGRLAGHGMPLPDDKADQMRRELRAKVTALWAETYSVSEMQGMVAFLESDVGRTYIQKSHSLVEQQSQIFREILSNLTTTMEDSQGVLNASPGGARIIRKPPD